MNVQELKTIFEEKFGEAGDIRTYFAPGRVNLIGEHTDYNGGHVFPCALTIGTYAVARKREDKVIKLYSANIEKIGVIESSLDDLTNKDESRRVQKLNQDLKWWFGAIFPTVQAFHHLLHLRYLQAQCLTICLA